MAKDEKVGNKKSRRDRNKTKVKPPSKIVIRHLPPTMTEEEFLKQIDPLPEYDFYYFAAADWSLGFDATCRAYITFKNYEDVFLFHQRFDGYVFVDSKGNEYAAIVEFAPFQGFVKNKSRNSDNKVNTIEQEPHYEQFLKKLEEEREAASKGGECKLEFSLDSKKEEITSTPLLQYLASKKEKRREESKKRTAEKKKRREDEKEKRKQVQVTIQTQPVKVLTADNSGKHSEKVEQKGTASQAREEPKNARSRRREERNRLRHEAYLQRKKALKEQHGNAKDIDTPSSEKDDPMQAKKEETKTSDKSSNEEKTKDTIEAQAPTEASKPIEILKKSKPVDMLTESVRNFIFSAASSLTTATASGDNASNDDKEEEQEDLKDLQENVAKLDLNNEGETETLKDMEKDLSQEKQSERERAEKERALRREERRIRNKDRPSIAIYTPKPRLRASEESDSNSTSTKDVRSLSVSDCENTSKRDDQPRQKKVQRYSERSKNRRKSLPKECTGDDVAQAD